MPLALTRPKGWTTGSQRGKADCSDSTERKAHAFPRAAWREVVRGSGRAGLQEGAIEAGSRKGPPLARNDGSRQRGESKLWNTPHSRGLRRTRPTEAISGGSPAGINASSLLDPPSFKPLKKT